MSEVSGACMILVFCGENSFLIKQALDNYVSAFEQKFGQHGIVRADGDEADVNTLREILMQGASLFSLQQLIILKNASKNKTLWSALADLVTEIPQDSTIIIIEPSPDKRTKTYKQLTKHGKIKIFNQLTEPDLVKWLVEEARSAQKVLSSEDARYLVQRVGFDQWQLWHELQKLLLIDKIDKKQIDNIVEPSSQATVFELIEAVFESENNRQSKILSDLSAKEDPYKFFGLLVAQVYALAVIKSAGDRSVEQIAKDSGIHPFVIKKNHTLAKNIDNKKLQKIIAALCKCDEHLKSTGADPWLLVRQCLGKIAN